jgi:hypothetical protein
LLDLGFEFGDWLFEIEEVGFHGGGFYRSCHATVRRIA